MKWYLNPILSPYFQIPESHVKEPCYLEDMTLIEEWLHTAQVLWRPNNGSKNTRGATHKFKPKDDGTPDMFENLDGESE